MNVAIFHSKFAMFKVYFWSYHPSIVIRGNDEVLFGPLASMKIQVFWDITPYQPYLITKPVEALFCHSRLNRLPRRMCCRPDHTYRGCTDQGCSVPGSLGGAKEQ
jgi:hypothetical protein